MKAEYENVKLEILNILFIEGLKDYLKIHLKNDGKAVLTLSNFKEIQQKLPSNFIRVHRSFLVNINAIVAYRKGKLIVGSNRISIGETYKKKVFEVLGI